MTVTFRDTKGANLTPAEVDENFRDLIGQIEDLAENPAQPVSIGNITVNGAQMSVILTDATVLGPFQIPAIRWFWRGEWTPSTAYYEMDIISQGRNGLYVVLFNHVSALTFDAEALNDSDELVYDQILGPFTTAATSQTISDATFTPQLEDADTYIRVNGDCAVTIPNNDTVPFTIDTELFFRQNTSGSPVSFLNGSGVTINYREGYDNITDGQGAVVEFKKIGTNEWDAFGAFALLGS